MPSARLLEKHYQEGFRAGLKQGYREGMRDADQQSGMIDPYPSYRRVGEKMPTRLKPKRKATAYQKRYGTAFKKLKRKHPRMQFGSLSKKAHRMARK